MTLLDVRLVSRFFLTVVATAAGIAAYWQIQTFKRFELMKMLESDRVKTARRALFASTKKRFNGKWWNFDDPQFDDQLEQAASVVCGAYDIVGIVAKGANRRFFRKHWGHGIRWTYQALEGFLEDRRTQPGGNPDAYSGYELIYNEAKK